MNLRLLDGILARRRAISAALAALIGLFVLAAGSGAGLEQRLRTVRDGIRSHPASGEIQIVEIDSRSIREMSNWPWPRRHHGALIDRLHGAGARTIAFDVDFSSPSNSTDDATMAGALARAGGGVVLAGLLQHEETGSERIVENVPIQPFRAHSFLAAVNVFPDGDGQVRQMPLGLEIAGLPRPSLAALVAEREAGVGGTFAIDFAIDPASIPRHSFVDVIRGRVPAAVLRGKRILVGATAVEMGDRYAVPGHGVIPGVVIQALAAETLLAGVPPRVGSPIAPLALAVIVIGLAMPRRRRSIRVAVFALGTLAVIALPLAGEQWLRTSYPLTPALAALGTAALLALGLHFANRFRQRSLVDDATGLPNAEALAADAEGTPVVVARIERFAAITAGIGPEATVNLLHRVADRLRFGQDRAIYRIDEAHLAWIEAPDGAGTLSERLEGLIALMRSPVDCGRLIDAALTFGIAEPGEQGIPQQIADAALAAERAAASGARWERFEGRDEEADWHLSLLGELDAAMAGGQLWNAYQPKCDLASGRIVGAEALVRWDHPLRGAIGPDRFIPLVEAHGRARDLTLHVLRQALEDAAGWRKAGLDLSVAVNVSATLLLDAQFAVLLEQEVRAARVPPEKVTLEVTESAAMKDSERAIAALKSWRSLGLAVSIDDYGTGQSSLAYLQTLPASELKIDRSFVTGLAGDSRNVILVRSTIAMAHELGMKVVAEGVEDAECLARLAEMGCDTAQGWLIGRPVDAKRLMELLAERNLAAA